MDLKTFIEEALVDIVDAVEDAQKQLLHGEVVPNRADKTGDADIEFEITVKPEVKEGQRPKLVVVTGSTSVKPPNAAPPPASGGGPPSPVGAPPPPPAGKLKFKIPVRLPQRRGCLLSRWIEYVIFRNRKKKAVAAPIASQKQLKGASGGKEQPEVIPKEGEARWSNRNDAEKAEKLSS